MIRTLICFAAEGVITDAETRQVSAFGLLENVQASSFPVALQRIALFCMWERALTDTPECGVELSVTLNGQEIARQIIDINFAQFLRTRSTIRFEGVTLAEPGNLVFRLALPGHDVAEWVVTVNRAAPTAPGPVGATAAGASSRVYESQPVSVAIGKVNFHR
jgi:hypothetical protein